MRGEGVEGRTLLNRGVEMSASGNRKFKTSIEVERKRTSLKEHLLRCTGSMRIERFASHN